MAKLVLASASPRRFELLKQIGIEAVKHPVDIDETPLALEPPEVYVERLSRTKAEQGLKLNPGNSVLGSDTVVVVSGEILGKPKNKADFQRMMALYSGQEHHVLTGVALANEHNTFYRLNQTLVKFREISDFELERYWQTGEPLDKAGGYGIQGKAAVFIESITGSHSGVMGLPLAETAELLEQAGFELW